MVKIHHLTGLVQKPAIVALLQRHYNKNHIKYEVTKDRAQKIVLCLLCFKRLD